MEFRNQRGAVVDPVPFFVVGASAVVVVYSFGPMYLTALHLPLAVALVVCTVVCAALLAIAYHRFVWTTAPAHRTVLPPAARLRRLAYSIAAGIALLGLLALPLVA